MWGARTAKSTLTGHVIRDKGWNLKDLFKNSHSDGMLVEGVLGTIPVSSGGVPSG